MTTEPAFKKVLTGYYEIFLQGVKIGFVIKAAAGKWLAFSPERELSSSGESRDDAACSLLKKILH